MGRDTSIWTLTCTRARRLHSRSDGILGLLAHSSGATENMSWPPTCPPCSDDGIRDYRHLAWPRRVARFARLIGCIAFALMGTAGPTDKAFASHEWRASVAGPAQDLTSIAWWDKGVAWVALRPGLDGKFFTREDSASGPSVLTGVPENAVDSRVTWMDGRFYWLRATYMSPGGSKPVRFDVLSMGFADASPQIIATRSEIGWLGAAGGRLVWTERLPGTRTWRTVSKRVADGALQRIRAFGGQAADLALSSSMVAWVPRRSATSITVVPIDSTGALATTSTVVPVAPLAGAKYQRGSLSIDGQLAAWSGQSGASAWDVYEWRLGQHAPRKLSSVRSGPPTGVEWEDSDPESGMMSPVVSAGRVTWRGWDGPKRMLMTWGPKDSSPTLLATCTYPRYFVLMAASGQRVVWLTHRAHAGIQDDEPQSPAIRTWRAGDRSAQAVHWPHEYESDSYVDALSVDGDRIAFDEGGLWVAGPTASRGRGVPIAGPGPTMWRALLAALLLLATLVFASSQQALRCRRRRTSAQAR